MARFSQRARRFRIILVPRFSFRYCGTAGPFLAAMHNQAGGMTIQFSWAYDRGETVADAVVHILGVTMAIAAAALLVVVAAHDNDVTEVVAVIIYIAGFLAMFGFSAAYNLWPISPIKWWLRRLDHSAIYLLIAATYTAFILPMHGTAPAVLLATIWLAALAGITIKVFWPGRFDRTSIGLYLAMGWSCLFAVRPIVPALTPGTLWLIAARRDRY